MCSRSCTREPAYRANSGGPSSRTRKEELKATLLGLDDGPIICPRQLCLALDFAGKDPVETTCGLLLVAGFDSAEDLLGLFGDELWPMVGRLRPDLPALEVATATPLEVLRVAYLLGHCTSVRLDPVRPVLWTQASLTRRLELFDVKEFYA